MRKNLFRTLLISLLVIMVAAFATFAGGERSFYSRRVVPGFALVQARLAPQAAPVATVAPVADAQTIVIDPAADAEALAKAQVEADALVNQQAADAAAETASAAEEALKKPICFLAEPPPANLDGSYTYNDLWVEKDTVVEGTQTFTGDTHIVWVNPPDGSVWKEMSTWVCNPGTPELRTVWGNQWVGDKVMINLALNLKMIPMTLHVNGETFEFAAGEIPATYSTSLSAQEFPEPVAMYVHGEFVDGNTNYSAAIGSPDEWSFVRLTIFDQTQTLRFFGPREGVEYSSVACAFRLPKNWTQEQVDKFEPASCP